MKELLFVCMAFIVLASSQLIHAQCFVVLADGNIRSGPSTGDKIVGYVRKWQIIEMHDDPYAHGEWFCIEKEQKYIHKSVGVLLWTTYDKLFPRVEAVKKHENWTWQEKKHVLRGIRAVGMTMAQVRAIEGNPDEVKNTVDSYGKKEHWIYSKNKMYLDFENGLLTSWRNW